MGLTKSKAGNVWSPNGNSLATFVNALDSQLWFKDAIGNIQPLSDFISNPSGSSPYQYDACTGSIKPVLGTNCANGQYSTVGGGQNNLVIGNNSYVGSGTGNSTCSTNAFIGGGESNTIFVSNSFIGAGTGNSVCSQWSAIVSGQNNCLGANLGSFSFIGAGTSNTILCGLSAIIAGTTNCITEQNSFIGVGTENIITAPDSFIGSGICNVAERNNSIVVGGELNRNNSRWGFIGGGYCNRIFNECVSSIVGGIFNEVCGKSSFIGGGCTNKAYCDFSIVLGGCENSALGIESVVVGGTTNSSCGSNSFIGAGSGNCANGEYSFVGSGVNNLACSAYSSIDSGMEAIAYLYAMKSFASGLISTKGDAQESKVIARKSASLDASIKTELFLDGAGELITPLGSNRAWNVYVDWVSTCVVLGTGTSGGLAVGDVSVGTSAFFFKKVSDISSISAITDSNPNSDTSMADSEFLFSVGASENLKIEFQAPSTAGTGTTFNVVAKIKLVEVAW